MQLLLYCAMLCLSLLLLPLQLFSLCSHAPVATVIAEILARMAKCKKWNKERKRKSVCSQHSNKTKLNWKWNEISSLAHCFICLAPSSISICYQHDHLPFPYIPYLPHPIPIPIAAFPQFPFALITAWVKFSKCGVAFYFHSSYARGMPGTPVQWGHGMTNLG